MNNSRQSKSINNCSARQAAELDHTRMQLEMAQNKNYECLQIIATFYSRNKYWTSACFKQQHPLFM